MKVNIPTRSCFGPLRGGRGRLTEVAASLEGQFKVND